MKNNKINSKNHFSKHLRASARQQRPEKNSPQEQGEKGGESENQRVENDGAEEL